MNKIKEIDILDKSKFTLNSLFNGEITILDKEVVLNENNASADGSLFFNGVEFSFTVLSKPSVRKITSLFNRRINSSKNNIFILDYASEEMINFFRSNNMFFADTAGNCFINLPNLKISIEGKKNILSNIPETKVAFQKTGLKLVFQLLIQPDLAHQSFREIASVTNISLASISNIFEELKEDGFIIEINKNKRKLSNIKRLITKWAISYAEVLRPKIHRGYFEPLNVFNLDSNLYAKQDPALYIGGEHGVYFLNGAIKPQHLILYTNLRMSNLVKKHKIIPKSRTEEEQIEILEVFWNNSFEDDFSQKKQISLDQAITHPILIYADLINSTNYRSIKAAEDLLENEIRNRFITDNFQW